MTESLDRPWKTNALSDAELYETQGVEDDLLHSL